MKTVFRVLAAVTVVCLTIGSAHAAKWKCDKGYQDHPCYKDDYAYGLITNKAPLPPAPSPEYVSM